METFIQQYRDFLYILSEDYGFLIPPDRMKACLVAAENIGDVEEVCYRTPSLICENKEQVDAFQSLFRQRFLNKKPESDSEAFSSFQKLTGISMKRDRITPENMENHAKNMEKKADLILKTADKNREEAVSLKQDFAVTNKTIKQTEAEIEEIKQENEKIRNEIAVAIKAAEEEEKEAVPNKENLDLLETFQMIEDEFDTAENMAKKKQKKTLQDIRNGLEKGLDNADFEKEIRNSANDLMNFASRVHNNKELFAQTLQIVKELGELPAAAKKAVPKGSLNKLVKSKRNIKKMYQKHSEMIDKEENLRWNLAMMNQSQFFAENRLRTLSRLMDQCERSAEEYRRQAAETRKFLEGKRKGNEEEIIKEGSKNHREEFLTGIHAVKTISEEQQLLETNLLNMTAEEKRKVLSFIRTKANVFRQTLRRQSYTVQHRKIDIKATVKESRKTGGEPVIIKYKAPKKSHAKVIILADISGSCRKASTLALYFMALMNDAFPGGCRKYAFVNSLVSVDRYFQNVSADVGVEQVLANIPTRGVYSDYGATLHQFRNECGGIVRKDTTVIMLGDARNNKRKDAANDLKYISDRCYRFLWLNTDDTENWDQGDSIISTYRDAGAEVYPVQTVEDLLNFLGTISLKPVID